MLDLENHPNPPNDAKGWQDTGSAAVSAHRAIRPIDVTKSAAAPEYKRPARSTGASFPGAARGWSYHDPRWRITQGVGYVRIRKGFVGKRPRTWAKLSANGRDAFEGHVLKLQEIVSQGGVTLLAPETESAATADSLSSPERNATPMPKAAVGT